MNDVDEEVRNHLRGLIDPEPLDTDRALRSVHASRLAHREASSRHTGLVALAAVAAVLATALLAATRGHQESPPYRLVGASGANVVVRIDSSDGQTPTATLAVGDTTVPGTAIAGTPTPGGISFGTGIKLPSEPLVDVPDGSSLRVEGTFDSASASSLSWIALIPDESGGMNVLNVGTWQLDSSGGSVAFRGRPGNSVFLIVQITTGADEHYFYFPIQIVPLGS
jgi:hypothetical protein